MIQIGKYLSTHILITAGTNRVIVKHYTIQSSPPVLLINYNLHVTPRCVAPHCVTLPCVTLPCITPHCVTFHCVALHCVALHCVTLRCVTLRFVTPRCVTPCCVTLHCVPLHCATLHCVTLHWVLDCLSSSSLFSWGTRRVVSVMCTQTWNADLCLCAASRYLSSRGCGSEQARYGGGSRGRASYDNYRHDYRAPSRDDGYRRDEYSGSSRDNHASFGSRDIRQNVERRVSSPVSLSVSPYVCASPCIRVASWFSFCRGSPHYPVSGCASSQSVLCLIIVQ